MQAAASKLERRTEIAVEEWPEGVALALACGVRIRHLPRRGLEAIGVGGHGRELRVAGTWKLSGAEESAADAVHVGVLIGFGLPRVLDAPCERHRRARGVGAGAERHDSLARHVGPHRRRELELGHQGEPERVRRARGSIGRVRHHHRRSALERAHGARVERSRTRAGADRRLVVGAAELGAERVSRTRDPDQGRAADRRVVPEEDANRCVGREEPLDQRVAEKRAARVLGHRARGGCVERRIAALDRRDQQPAADPAEDQALGRRCEPLRRGHPSAEHLQDALAPGVVRLHAEDPSVLARAMVGEVERDSTGEDFARRRVRGRLGAPGEGVEGRERLFAGERAKHGPDRGAADPEHLSGAAGIDRHDGVTRRKREGRVVRARRARHEQTGDRRDEHGEERCPHPLVIVSACVHRSAPLGTADWMD